MSEDTSIATTSSSWLLLALQSIQQNSHLNNELCDVLRAFGKSDDDAPGPCNLDPNADGSTVDALQHRIATELLTEIDANQAQMFGRRFASVSTLLQENYIEKNNQQSVTTKQLLCLALHRRTVQILTTTDPVLSQRKALRIRALVDFIWSQSLVLDLRDDPQNNHLTLTELVHKHELHSCTSTQYNEFAPGFYHATFDDVSSDFGLLHINILRININNVQMKCLDARKKCTDLSTLAKNEGALCAISGGFFLYSEPDIKLPSKRTDPIALLIEDKDEICNPPVFQRSSIFQKENGSIGLDKIGMEGVTCTFLLESDQEDVSMHLKLTIGQDNVRCVHRGDAEDVVIQEDECAFQIIGRAITHLCLSPTKKFPVPLAGFVLIFTKSSHPNAINLLLDNSLAMSVTYQLPAPFESIYSAMAGGPMLFSDESESHIMDLPSEDFKLSAPPITFSQDETHDHNLLPRMGVGLAKCSDFGHEQLVCVAIDGRNLDRALGLTLQGTSDLLRSLGCYKGMNLDGGSSKRMVIYDPQQQQHKVVCLSTTEIKASNNGGEDKKVEPSRPVHSAILFLPKK